MKTEVNEDITVNFNFLERIIYDYFAGDCQWYDQEVED